MANDNAFRSQQFVEGIEQRRDQYSRDRSAAYRSLPDATIGRFQQTYAQQQGMQQAQESHQVEMLKASSTLALDELRRKQAQEELAWAKELHSTDMIKMERDKMQASTDYEVARLAKMRKDLEGADDFDTRGMTPDRMLGLLAMGIDVELSGNHIRAKKAAPDRQEWAKKQVEERNSLGQQRADNARDQIAAKREYTELQRQRMQNAASNVDSAIKRQTSIIDALMDAPGTTDEDIEAEVQHLAELLQQRRQVREAAGADGPADGPATSTKSLLDDFDRFLQGRK